MSWNINHHWDLPTILREDLVVGDVYLLKALNIRLGVWTGEGFIGVREKGHVRRLELERFATADECLFGSAQPKKYIGRIPHTIPLTMLGEHADNRTGNTVERLGGDDGDVWRDVKTGEQVPAARIARRQNHSLHLILEEYEVACSHHPYVG